MLIKSCSIFIIPLLLLFTTPSYSKDLGAFGKTYEIAEQDFLEFIKERLQKLAASGQLASLQAKLGAESRKKIDRPTPVKEITKATKNRSWVFDPTITPKQDIKDASDNAIIKAGTKVNPLNLVSLTKTLIFYDADDKEQVMWVQKIDKELRGKTKLILVNGSIFEQVKLFQKAIYFDQSGKITSHFSIKHVPATVAQIEVTDNVGNKQKRLNIMEILCRTQQ